jgi:hypothetical protein
MPVNFGKELKTKMSQEFGKNNPGGAEYMRDADSLLSKIKEVDDIEKPKKKKSENKEATGSGSAGGYSMPLFSTTKKEMEDEVKKVETKEATGSGSSGSYVTPAAWAKSTNKKDWRGKSKTQIPGGKFVQVKKKCKKFPYCNQGDINALKLTDARLMDEAVKNVAKKLNLSESVIKTIIKNKSNIGKNERVTISSNKITDIKNISQDGLVFGKPNGLWYSFGVSWINFVEMEFSDEYFSNKKFAYKIYPNMDKIKVLRTKEDVYNFTSKYLILSDPIKELYDIDWKRVADDYSGIEIPTYDELDMRDWHQINKNRFYWLYPWDVPSGCIWKIDGIERIKSL